MNGFEMILPFLKPIEHLILDDSISEVMVNGADRVFVEKAGFVEEVHGLSIENPDSRGKKYRLAGRRYFRVTNSRLTPA
jgi:type IV secretory pathway ATPase VirB11/archaellum biosynthesis ATPase